MTRIRQFRRATPDDVPIITEFNLRLAAESEGKALDRVTTTQGVAALVADSHKGFYTLAEEEGVIVGQVCITYEFSDWRNGWFWWIQSVYVPAEHRRRGVFRSLYEELERQAHDAGDVVGLRLYVEHDNATAQATYTQLGMQPESYAVMACSPLRPRRPESHG
jgi:ribosomal protein S18 acetylase RimI-like enzyme